VNATGETAHFAALDGDRVVYLAKVDSPHPIRMFSQIGWRGPLHATGVGKVLLASTEAKLLSRVCDQGLERFTRNTIVEKEQLQAELAQIRKQGYALDAEELIDGLTCVAVPVMSGEQGIQKHWQRSCRQLRKRCRHPCSARRTAMGSYVRYRAPRPSPTRVGRYS
jgi:IclR family acetate operon transcriptional repressor